MIGAGQIGSCLASKFIKLRYHVSIANSRGPASLKELAEQTRAEAVTVEDDVITGRSFFRWNKVILIAYGFRSNWVLLWLRYSIPFLRQV
ncbi:NAD(P)-binding domain-containing protein [Pedobacter sp. NJ-S-72]